MLVEPNKVSTEDAVCRVLEVHETRDGLVVTERCRDDGGIGVPTVNKSLYLLKGGRLTVRVTRSIQH
jgi:hypothetical protein